MDRNLSAFLAIAREHSLTAAADRLRLAQPSVTKRLKLLEDEFQTELFEREARGVKLTPAGTKLLSYACKIENEYLQAREAVAAVRSKQLEVLRVGAGPLFARGHLSSVFHQLRQEFPETRLVLHADIHLLNLPKLQSGELDIVLGSLVSNLGDESITTHSIAEVQLGALASDSLDLAAQSEVDVADLTTMEWIIYSQDPDTSSMVRGYFHRNGLLPPNIAVQTSSYELALNLLATGQYLMPAPMGLDPTFAPLGLRMLNLKEPLDRFPTGSYVRNSSLAYPVVVRLLELVEDRLKREGFEGPAGGSPT